MAVHEHAFTGYDGPHTTAWHRRLVIPRFAYEEVFASPRFTAFYALCFIAPAVGLLVIYLRHNATALQLLDIRLAELAPIDGGFFLGLLNFQLLLAFLVTLVLGPALVSADLQHGALPLYLYRPFSRAEYIAGKAATLAILLSLITWVPALALWGFQAYLEGWAWASGQAWILVAIVAGGALVVSLLCVVSLALSAWVRRKTAARGLLLGALFFLGGFSEALNGVMDWEEDLRTVDWASLLSPGKMVATVLAGLFHEAPPSGVPTAAAWAVLGLIVGVSLWLLERKLRAYHVVRA